MALPLVKSGSLIRTDFTDEARWGAVLAEAFEPDADGFSPCTLAVVDDPAFDGATPSDVVAAVAAGTSVNYLMVADAITMSDGTILVIKPGAEPDRFRTTISGVASIDNNLSIANMDFEEFARAADPAGVFRGF